MRVHGVSINGLILARDNILWLCGDIGLALAAISRDSDQDRLSNAKRKSEEKRRNSRLMNERELTVGGTRTIQALFRYSFNDVTKARTLVQPKEKRKRETETETERERRNSTPYGIIFPPRKSTLTPFIESPIGWWYRYVLRIRFFDLHTFMRLKTWYSSQHCVCDLSIIYVLKR